jgi:hypothetical protein
LVFGGGLVSAAWFHAQGDYLTARSASTVGKEPRGGAFWASLLRFSVLHPRPGLG